MNEADKISDGIKPYYDMKLKSMDETLDDWIRTCEAWKRTIAELRKEFTSPNKSTQELTSPQDINKIIESLPDDLEL